MHMWVNTNTSSPRLALNMWAPGPLIHHSSEMDDRDLLWLCGSPCTRSINDAMLPCTLHAIVMRWSIILLWLELVKTTSLDGVSLIRHYYLLTCLLVMCLCYWKTTHKGTKEGFTLYNNHIVCKGTVFPSNYVSCLANISTKDDSIEGLTACHTLISSVVEYSCLSGGFTDRNNMWQHNVLL